MVLAVAPTGLFSRRSGDWSVRYELRGISARDENGRRPPPERPGVWRVGREGTGPSQPFRVADPNPASAQAQLASIHSQLISARNTQALARLTLLRAVGLSLDTPVRLSD